MDFRIGYGYDVHRLDEGRELILGGIKIPHDKGCVAHSDGDVLIHAICDALLGAAALRDIGYHFPDNDASYQSVDSKILLKKTVGLIKNEGYIIGNIDCTICLQSPKINNLIPDMKKQLARVCKVQENQISIKATTTEKLGFVGSEEGISSYAIALITKC